MAVMQMIAFKEEDLERSKARCRDGFSLAQATPAKLAQEGEIFVLEVASCTCKLKHGV